MKKTFALLASALMFTSVALAAPNKYTGTFTGNGSGLTNYAATNLTGNVPLAALTNVFNGTTVVNGGGVTNLNAGQLTPGTNTSPVGFGTIRAAGNITFSADNTYTIGASGGKPSGVYVSQIVEIGSRISVSTSGSIGSISTLNGTSLGFLINGVTAATVPNSTNWNFVGVVTATNGFISGGSIKFISVTASNPPTSGSGTAFIFAATNGVTGTAELYAMDGSGNVTIISPHSQEAPLQLYDDDDDIPKISKEVNLYTGKVRWINESRAMRQQEMLAKLTLNSLSYYQFTTGRTPAQWTNSGSFTQFTNAVAFLDPLTAAQKQLIMVESFTGYNTRMGLTNGNGLVKLNWSDVQNGLQADYANGFTNSVLSYQSASTNYQSALTNYQAQVAAGSTNAVAPVLPIAPIWTPPVVQPVPAWLQKRGVN